MRRILDLLAVPATRAPAWTLIGLLLVTIGMGVATTQLEVSSDLSDFAPEGGLSATVEDIDERFGAGDMLQVIVDAGPGGNVLTPEGITLGADLRAAVETDETLAPMLAADATDRPAVLSYAEPFLAATEIMEIAPAELDEPTTEVLVRSILADEVGGLIAPLLSQDLDASLPSARAGLAVVELAPGFTGEQITAASDALEEAAASVEADGFRLSVVSTTTVERAIQDGLMRDMPILMGLSLLLVVIVLAVMFRSVADVAVGLVGLLASIIWMTGFGALLGPGMLGLIGPFGQIAIAVPVLLVGLGVDYAVHLTTRYREQQARGDAPVTAARTAVHTVGVALVLATLATVGGFMANLATPLPPIADLGVFASVGIVSAFAILGLAVPAVRVLIDRRRVADDTSEAGSGNVDAHAARPPSRLVALGTSLATRRSLSVALVSLVLVGLAGVGASGLGSEFDGRAFLPNGSPVKVLVERIDLLFGGDVGEQTSILVDGDTSDPSLVAAAARLERDLAQVEGVRLLGDRAQTTSPFEVVHRLGENGARTRSLLADDLDRWSDPEGAANEVPLPDELDVETLLAGNEDTVDIPEDLRAAVARRLPAGHSPVVAIVRTSDPIRLQEQVRSEIAGQFAASRPEGLSDAALATLAELPPAELTVQRLEAEGFPLDVLAPDTRAGLELADALEAASWTEDDVSLAPADVAAQLAVAAEHEPEEISAVLADDGVLIVVGTEAGTDGAEDLAARMRSVAEPVEAAGGEVTVVSQALVDGEIAREMSDAQLLAIVISVVVAAALLIVATWVSDRSIVLGLIGVVPAVSALLLVLGTMWAIGLSFNALTATVASIAVGIGVPYGIHLTNRFRASLEELGDVTEAIRDTLTHTGGALAGSAITTGLAFGVMVLSSSTPLVQFGAVSAMMIAYALAACLVLQPALLAMWARRRLARASGPDEDTPVVDEVIDLVDADPTPVVP